MPRDCKLNFDFESDFIFKRNQDGLNLDFSGHRMFTWNPFGTTQHGQTLSDEIKKFYPQFDCLTQLTYLGT